MRRWLILLQVLGGVSLIPHPIILFGTLYSSYRAVGIENLPYLLVMIYPAFWIFLWVRSWKHFRLGAVRRALWLSAIPLVVSLLATWVIVQFILMRPPH